MSTNDGSPAFGKGVFQGGPPEPDSPETNAPQASEPQPAEPQPTGLEPSPPPRATPNPFSPNDQQTVVVGLSKSGKTSLLAALDLHTRHRAGVTGHADINIVPDDTDDGARFEKLQTELLEKATEKGQFGAESTGKISAYRFTLDLTTTRTEEQRINVETPAEGMMGWLGKKHQHPKVIMKSVEVHKRYHFLMSDGPGDPAWKQPVGDEAERDRILREELRRNRDNCTGLLFCVDSEDTSKRSEFLVKAKNVLRTLAPGSRRKTTLKRVAIVLTKADMCFAHHGNRALAELEQADPRQRLKEIIGVHAWGDIVRFLDRKVTQVACGWASAYGFLPDGNANYIDPNGDGTGQLRIFNPDHPEKTNWDLWAPYCVLDPFVFVASGEPGSMKLL